MKKQKIFFIVLATLIVAGILYLTRGLPYKEINPQWANRENVVKLDDAPKWSLWGQPWYYEFSSDSKYFAVWNHETNDFSDPPYICIWDLKGSKVTDAINSNKMFMNPKFRKLFDKCALREAPFWDTINGKYLTFTPYPDITKYAIGWFISPDWKYMVTFGDARYEPGTLSSDIVMQMWQLEPKVKILWESSYKGNSEPDVGSFYSQDGSLYLLIIHFNKVYIYSCKDGKLIRSFDLIKNVSEKELETISGRTVYSPEKELIACQGESKSFRVFSIKDNLKLVYEGNKKEARRSKSSWRYASGPWIPNGIRFGGSGNYLIVSYELGTRAKFRPIPQQLVTEIYDTDTWKMVWKKNTSYIQNIVISNDGKKVALKRDGVFEIGDTDSFFRGYSK